MKRIALTATLLAALLAPATPRAQVVGKATLGIAVAEMETIVLGWSAKKDLLGKPIYNEKSEKIGTLDDIIITPDKAVSYAIVGAGGFVGLAKHDVAIPMSQLKLHDEKFVLEGATKELIKEMPKFEYAKR